MPGWDPERKVAHWGSGQLAKVSLEVDSYGESGERPPISGDCAVQLKCLHPQSTRTLDNVVGPMRATGGLLDLYGSLWPIPCHI